MDDDATRQIHNMFMAFFRIENVLSNNHSTYKSTTFFTNAQIFLGL
jgi:hypothetical protein